MCDFLVLTQSASLLIIAVILCLALKYALSLWSLMRTEFCFLRNLIAKVNSVGTGDSCAGSKSKSTSIDSEGL